MTPCPKCGKPAVCCSSKAKPYPCRTVNRQGLCSPCFKEAQRQATVDRIVRLANWLAVTGRTYKEAAGHFKVGESAIEALMGKGMEWARNGVPPLCIIALTCAAVMPPIPKLSSARPHRTALRLALQSPKGMEVFPLAGAITSRPKVVTLAWDYSFADPTVDRFKSYCWTNMVGTNFQGYKETTWQGKVLTGRVSNLVAKATYWFAVQAGATNGLWSDPSNVITDHPTNLVVTFTYGGPSMQWATSPSGPWKATNSVVNITNATAPRLYFRGVGITNRVAISTMKY